MLVKSPWWGCFIHFFAGTLTFIRTIDTFVEFFCHRTWTIHSSRLFLFFWWGRLGQVASSSHPIHNLNKASLKRNKFCYPDTWQALKTSLSRILATGELRTWLRLNGHSHCNGYQKLCLSRHRKVDLISFRSCIRTLASHTHSRAQKLTEHLQSNLSITYPELK
jgi:hypothetical protein